MGRVYCTTQDLVYNYGSPYHAFWLLLLLLYWDPVAECSLLFRVISKREVVLGFSRFLPSVAYCTTSKQLMQMSLGNMSDSHESNHYIETGNPD